MAKKTIILDEQKGAVNGIAELNGTQHVPDAQISSSSIIQHGEDIQNLGIKTIQNSEEEEDETTSTDPQLATSFTETLETAKYRIDYQMELKAASISASCNGLFEVDDGVSPVTMGDCDQPATSFCIRSGFYFLEATAGDYDFNFYFNKSTGAGTVLCRRKRLMITKVVE